MKEWLIWSLPKYRRFIKRYPHEIPNAARIGDSGHYEIGNIKIISQRQNRAEQAERASLRPNGMKACRKCKVVKVLSEFGVRSNVRDGRQARCKQCRKIASP